MTTITTANGKTVSVRSCRMARKIARREGLVWGAWGSRNQTLHHGCGEYWALTTSRVDFGRHSVGVGFLVNPMRPTDWISGGQKSVGQFVSSTRREGWVHPSFLVRWVNGE